jgi:predicted MPP superfamily phosphohydrolase
MTVIRKRSPPEIDVRRFHGLGFAKYALACAALVLTWGAWWLGVPWWLVAPASILAFYAVEVQFVFLFPLAIDGCVRPWREARSITSAMGTLDAMAVVMPLAAVMLAGGFLGQGFVRCWCLGCLAVTLWYEEERTSAVCLKVRVERVKGPAALRLLWITDLHLTARSGVRLGARLCRTARRVRPDMIVLGGDIVESRDALYHLERILGVLCRIAPTHVLPGNHDGRAGLEEFRKTVEACRAFWHAAPGFSLDPRTLDLPVDLAEAPAAEGSLVFVHDPAELDEFAATWAAAFAGHLHGGQAILWKKGEREYPGAWISRWNGPRFETPLGPVIVSRGVADTLPLRWNCPREVILCEIC